MKKILLGLCLFSSILLVGCTPDSKDKDLVGSSSDVEQKAVDGTYTLEEKNYKNDYKYTMTLEIKDGIISEVDFDSINKEGLSKREDSEYIEIMKEKSGTSPDVFLDELENNLEEVKDPSKVDTISGATHTADSFKEYATMILEQAEKGNTEKIVVDNPVE